ISDEYEEFKPAEWITHSVIFLIPFQLVLYLKVGNVKKGKSFLATLEMHKLSSVYGVTVPSPGAIAQFRNCS
ncbi:16220_t:CDS:2, partial [Acaulospora morrowiae]